ncbi:ABC transporter permease [Pollutimonas bauzanensis]|uniref:ABC-type nitrate/sulfonate/bicarbonate transport system, permease component n=1 Tax=Pollutimonas bauzanensis TaxID=658167 RepID=A0A1M5ZEL7_9BURK|nr:ABC transporter permease subunit [Pollutimonas bauzanensis]SHI22592.1 ABC-type nitrate/sulfonate/bicarbonate transport system, permease component [Pollutimonas bauzanensis]
MDSATILPADIRRRGRAGAASRHRVALLRCAVILLSIVLLEIASRLAWIDPISFIPPSEMAWSAWRLLQEGSYQEDMLLTLSSAAVSILMATSVGFLFGLALFKLPRLRRVIDPLLLSYYAVPIFIFYPMLIVLFGLNRWPLIVLGFLFAVVAMAVNTLNGLERVPKVLLRTARMLRMGRAQEVFLITLPASLPFVFTGIKLAIVYSFIAIIGGEFLLSGAGFGYQIAFAYNNFDNPTMYGLMFLLLAFVGAVNLALHAMEQRLYQRRVLKELA